jgi:hypothetical protein
MSFAGCVTPFKRGKATQLRFSFMPVVMKSPGLKPIEAKNARTSSAYAAFSKIFQTLGFMAHVLGANRLHTIAASRCY